MLCVHTQRHIPFAGCCGIWGVLQYNMNLLFRSSAVCVTWSSYREAGPIGLVSCQCPYKPETHHPQPFSPGLHSHNIIAMYFVGSKSSRLFVAPITSKLKGKMKVPQGEEKWREKIFIFFQNGSHTESGEKKEMLCSKDTKIQNRTWCKELLGYLCSHIEESTIPSCLGKRKFLIFKTCCVLNKKQLCKGNPHAGISAWLFKGGDRNNTILQS
jgi:hypothetical protein